VPDPPPADPPPEPPKKPIPDKKDPPKPEKPPDRPPAPPAADPLHKAIQAAINRGVAHLRTLQQPDGSWKFAEMGATALAGLTLLECDVAADDDAVARAAQYVRQASVGCTHTYSLALGILFLDRLGDPEDVPLIESMGVRLLGGQAASGGWGYTCPAVSDTEARRLDRVVRLRKPPADRPASPPAAGKRTVKDLHPEIRQQLMRLATTSPAEGPGDNSNTQFATIGLWVARRHGLPVDGALDRVERRFRSTQNADGGWGYLPPAKDPAESTPTMTCAGALGLVVADGARAALVREGTPKVKAFDPRRDPNLIRALAVLNPLVGHPTADPKDFVPPKVEARTFYLLWALERVCVALDLKTLARKDWHAWGSEVLLASQQDDGSWKGEFAGHGGADTCFALLFLKRSNLTRDLHFGAAPPK
jgi:hypothetical protein